MVLALRRDRLAAVRQVIEGLTDESLAGQTEPVEGPGWPPARHWPVRECLLTLLAHQRLAEQRADSAHVGAQQGVNVEVVLQVRCADSVSHVSIVPADLAPSVTGLASMQGELRRAPRWAATIGFDEERGGTCGYW